jgi:ABC-type nitrate/sulfonate/bicarbonate transport system substrate-binding protein
MARKVVYGMPTERSAPSVQYGVARGFFHDEGINLSAQAFHGGPAIATALDRGELEFAHLGTPPALVACSRGARFRAVGSAIKRRLHLYLGLRSNIFRVEGLRGGRLGLLSMGSCDEWVGRRMLQTYGLQAGTDVELVPLYQGYENIVELIAACEIDGAIAIEPSMSSGEEAGVLKIWAAAYEEPYLPVFQWNVLAASDRLIDADPGLLKALLRGYARSSRAAREEPDDFIAFTAEMFRLPLAIVRRSVLREIEHYEFACQIDYAGLEKAIALQSSLSALERPVTAADFLDLRYVPEPA